MGHSDELNAQATFYYLVGSLDSSPPDGDLIPYPNAHFSFNGTHFLQDRQQLPLSFALHTHTRYRLVARMGNAKSDEKDTP